MMKTPLWLSLLLLLAGCHHEAPHSMEPLVFPPASEIEEIAVIRMQPDGRSRTEFKIHDRQKSRRSWLSSGRSTGTFTYRWTGG